MKEIAKIYFETEIQYLDTTSEAIFDVFTSHLKKEYWTKERLSERTFKLLMERQGRTIDLEIKQKNEDVVVKFVEYYVHRPLWIDMTPRDIYINDVLIPRDILGVKVSRDSLKELYDENYFRDKYDMITQRTFLYIFTYLVVIFFTFELRTYVPIPFSAIYYEIVFFL